MKHELTRLDPYFDAARILRESGSTVEYSDSVMDGEGRIFRSSEYAGWTLTHGDGGVIGWPRPTWTEEQAIRAAGMFIWLWEHGVPAPEADTLAGLWADRVEKRRMG